MSDLLLNRESSIIIDNLRYDGLRLQFKVVKTHKKQPNTAQIVITNLNRNHRAIIPKRHAKVVLLAGYEGRSSQVFSGDARYTDPVKAGTDWEVHIQCGDGEKQYVYARVNTSWAAGTPLSIVARDLARASGLGLGNLELALGTAPPTDRPVVTKYDHGFVANGPITIALDKVLRAGGFEWSIQDGNLQVLRPGGTINTTRRAPLLSRDSGLIGDPVHGAPEKKGKPSPLKLKCLLQPSLRPGGLVQIRTEALDGLYRVSRVEHTGDSRGGNWYSELEVFRFQ